MTGRLAHQSHGHRAFAAHAYHHPVRTAGRHVALAFAPAIEQVGDLLQRQFAQARQVRGGEEIPQRPFDSLGGINLAGRQAVLQILGRQIDVHQLVGFRQHIVRHPFLDLHSRELLDDIAQAFQMLDVHRRDHVDAVPQQFLDILIALGKPSPRGVGVGQFVHDHHRRFALDHRIEVHLAKDDAVILDAPGRHLLQFSHLRDRLGPAVGLHDADHHVDPLAFEPPGFLQHLEGLAHPRGETEVNLQPAGFLFADQ